MPKKTPPVVPGLVATLDRLIAATQAMLDANQQASEQSARAVWRLVERVEYLETKVTLLEEWACARFQELRRS
jgi:hypothetical protein